VTWSASTPTNPGSTQARVFSGFCRDNPGSGGFAQPAQPCWENGMAIGACAGTFDSCEQREEGAFGPNGSNFQTIVAIGNGANILGGPAAGTLVSIFTIPPTYNPTVDAAGSLPGPGAVAVPVRPPAAVGHGLRAPVHRWPPPSLVVPPEERGAAPVQAAAAGSTRLGSTRPEAAPAAAPAAAMARNGLALPPDVDLAELVADVVEAALLDAGIDLS